MASRRIFSVLASKIHGKPILQGNKPATSASRFNRELSTFRNAVTRDFHPSQKPFSSIHLQNTRRLQTLAETSIENQLPDHENCNSKPNQIKPVSDSINEETTVTHKVNANLKVSARHDLAMIFTCRVCDTRSTKTVCRESYDKGVVVVRCDGCNNLHLIADRLGWFGAPSSVEEFLAVRGEEVKKGSVDTLSLTLEELAGKKIL